MSLRSLAATAAIATVVGTASAGQIYFNGFEVNDTDWTSATRVASGTNGVTSATGSFHATSSAAAFTRWGGYNYGAGNAVPTVFQSYTTTIDIFLDVGAGLANNTRFDFSSAINNSGGTFQRDFIYNAGFYNTTDLTGPGAGTNRFVISSSNNSQPGSAFAKNPARGPIAISATGWYTFAHKFYDNAGVLAVDMSIYDSSASLVSTWTLSDPTDLISTTGGNRYGWFDYNQIANLAFDNSSLTTLDNVIPLPTAGGMASLGMLVLGARRRRTR